MMLKNPNIFTLLLLGILLSVYSLFIGGIDFAVWRFYGFEYLDYIINPSKELLQSSTFSNLHNNVGPVLIWFFNVFANLVRIPFYYILAGLLLKTLLLPVLYYFNKSFIQNNRKALLLATLALISQSSFSLATGGGCYLWDPPLFNKGVLASALVLLSVSLWLRNRIVIASVLLGLAYNFHLFNALAAMFFSIPPLIFFSRENLQSKLKRTFTSTFIQLIFLIGYIKTALQSSVSAIRIDEKAWFTMVLKLNDVYLIDHILPLLPPFFLNIWIYINHKENLKSEQPLLHSMLLWGFGLMIFAALLDLMNIRSFFIPVISEILTAIELRRGVWIVGLLTFISSFILNKKSEVTDYKKFILFLAHIVLMLKWSSIGGILYIIFNSIFYSKISKSIATLFIFSILLSSYFGGWERSEGHYLNRFIWLMLALSTGTLIALYLKKDFQLKVRLATYSIVVLSVTLFLTSAYRNNILKNDLQIISKTHGSFFDPANLEKSLTWRAMKESGPSQSDESLKNSIHYKLSKAINKHYPGSGFIWTPISIYPGIANTPIYFDPFWSYFPAFYSRSNASQYNLLLQNLYRTNIKELFSSYLDQDANGSTRIQELHSYLSEEEVIQLMNKKNVSVFISKVKYIKLRLKDTVFDYYIYTM